MTEKRNNASNVPTLRFPGFIDEWVNFTLDELCDKIGDGLHGTPSYMENTGYYFINGNNLVNGNIVITESTKEVLQDDYLKNDKKLNFNSVLISINGTIGNVAKYNGQCVMLGKSVAYLTFKSNREFYYHLISSNRIQNHFTSELTGSTIKNLSLKTIRDTIVSIPSIAEQEKISMFLTLIDDRIATQNKIIEELKLLKSTLCAQLLEAHKGFPFKTSEIATIGRGRVISSREISNQRNPLYPVYSSQTSNNGIMGYLDEYDFDGEYITWTTDGANAGTVFHRTGKFNCTNVCGVLKIKDTSKVNPKFVALALQSQTKKYVSTNLANPKLMNNVMAGISIHLPQIKIQNRISILYNGVDLKTKNEINYLDYLIKQKKYFLDQLFK